MNPTHLKLGTRKSLLAIAQSTWVARQVERLNPGVTVELVGIETKGDIILDKPLSQIEGKEFFTAELDLALLRKEVDFTVHSMKDLALERPPSFVLAAVPARELQHDIIVYHASVIERIQAGLPVRIGTSSPRRLTLIPAFLKNALPRFHPDTEPTVQFVEIRGNVNTRLSRVHEPEGTVKKLDGVVLAFAGLERLAQSDHANPELRRLLENTIQMILPLKFCPSAPAQGALAIESLADSKKTREILLKLHHPETLQGVIKEREILAEWGGGCHLKLGASMLPGGALFIQGQKPNGEWVNETRFLEKPEKTSFTKIEASDVFDFEECAHSEAELSLLEKNNLVFIAHSRAFQFLKSKSPLLPTQKKRIWVSGTQSWFKLAKEGMWIEGCLDGQGFETIHIFTSKKLLSIGDGPFLFLSHKESPNYSGTRRLGTYTHKFREIPEKFTQNSQIYWSSSLPFLELWNRLGSELLLKKEHACGPGKTAQVISEKLNPFGRKPKILSME